MKKLKDVMTRDVHLVGPETSLFDVASKMRKLGVGGIPVGEEKLLGMVTDRDIVLRALAEGRDVSILAARDVMTSPIVYCFEDQDIDDAARLMEVKQIRRLVVLNRDKRLVGIVTLGDLALKADASLSGEVLGKVSEPPKELPLEGNSAA